MAFLSISIWIALVAESRKDDVGNVVDAGSVYVFVDDA